MSGRRHTPSLTVPVKAHGKDSDGIVIESDLKIDVSLKTLIVLGVIFHLIAVPIATALDVILQMDIF